jgi:hypothetical protein
VKCLSYFPDKWPLESQFLTGHLLSSIGRDKVHISALLVGRPLLFLVIERTGAFFPDAAGAFVGLDSGNVASVIKKI